MKKIQFPGLNGVRFIAALLVMVDHLELFKSYMGYPTLWANSYSAYLGSLGVSIFFVLSGFLITYLLLEERKIAPIHIKHFYLRRVLRIWPLYYFILGLGFFVIPQVDYFQMPNYSTDMGDSLERLLLFTGLAANVAFVYLPTVPFANVLWSVAVEEQFYLFWPHVVRLKRNLGWIMLGLLVGYLVLKFYSGALDRQFELLLIRTRFSAMILGGIGAYLLFHQKAVIHYLYSRWVQAALLGVFGLMLINKVNYGPFSWMQDELISLVVCGLILNIATNPKSLVSLENRVFHYFGKLSYGLYVYHLFAVVLVLKGLPEVLDLQALPTWLGYPLTLGAVLLLTTGISHLSYKYFESYFLKKKVKFSTVLSGDMVDRPDDSRGLPAAPRNSAGQVG